LDPSGVAEAVIAAELFLDLSMKCMHGHGVTGPGNHRGGNGLSSLALAEGNQGLATTFATDPNVVSQCNGDQLC
jgi:hypothetical protein